MLGKGIRKDLDGHWAPKVGIERAIDFAHAARADLGRDFVRAEACAGTQSHAIRLEL